MSEPPTHLGDDRSKIVILAGPNGAGKTTFARTFLPGEASIIHFVNADLIAAGLSPFDPDSVAVQAGKLMLREIESLVAARRSFAMETTLSGLMYARRIREWRDMGYAIHLVFLGLNSEQLALDRVAARVRSGGHAIPADVIVRRFRAGWSNFQTLYKSLVDTWQHYDNSGPVPRFIEGGTN